MIEHYDIAIIGAGPSGMAAAELAASHQARVLILDEQAQAGGQLYRAVASLKSRQRPELGDAYAQGLPLLSSFLSSKLDYQSNAVVWQIATIDRTSDSTSNKEIHYTQMGKAHAVSADQLIIASGAQERPFPVPGWTLPGVMTVGAAQILLKESEIAIKDAVFVGTGPLLYLAVHQYLAAGIAVKAVIDLTPRINYFNALEHLPQALGNLGKILQGWRWQQKTKRAGIPWINGVSDVRINGENAVSNIEYYRSGRWHELECDHVLLHQGVVPNINISRVAGCDCRWDATQLCWQVQVDEWFESSQSGISVIGDAAAIVGGVASMHSGRIAALGALKRIGIIDHKQRDKSAIDDRAAYQAELNVRPFLDTLFQPAKQFRVPPSDDTIVCRCEEVSAGEIRKMVDIGCIGPNQLKSFSRCGMGPCQGRLCGLTVSEIIADRSGIDIESVGYYRIRTPIKPVRLGELAQKGIVEPLIES